MTETVYVMRDESRKIVGVFSRDQEGFSLEPLPDNSPDVAAFLNPPGFYTISKTRPWLRMSEDEADTVAAAMDAADNRLRAIYSAAQHLQSNDPLWPMFKGILSTALSPERAEELLARES